MVGKGQTRPFPETEFRSAAWRPASHTRGRRCRIRPRGADLFHLEYRSTGGGAWNHSPSSSSTTPVPAAPPPPSGAPPAASDAAFWQRRHVHAAGDPASTPANAWSPTTRPVPSRCHARRRAVSNAANAPVVVFARRAAALARSSAPNHTACKCQQVVWHGRGRRMPAPPAAPAVDGWRWIRARPRPCRWRPPARPPWGRRGAPSCRPSRSMHALHAPKQLVPPHPPPACAHSCARFVCPEIRNRVVALLPPPEIDIELLSRNSR